jgi:RNA polymerase sigma factor (sigma-70 family)
MGDTLCAELLDRIRSNDRRFLGELALVVERIAQRWALPAWMSVEDVAQDCLVKLIQNLERGKFAGQSSFKTYVYAIARNTCIDYCQLARAVELVDIEEVTVANPDSSPEKDIISAEERRVACKVLMSLPPECRRLWRAIFFGKRNYRQAAELLGLSEGTVKRRMWECRRIARKLVERLEK